MIVEFHGSNHIDLYHALIGIVTPRPIAWVTSVDGEGGVNLAPFSFFNVFGSNPPVVAFSPTLRRDGSKKDTLRNVEETGEFVLNAAVVELAEQVNLSSKEIPHEESEVDLTGLTLAPSLRVRPPRIAESPVHMECRLRQVLTIGDGPGCANLVIGDVLLVDVADRLLGPDGRVDPTKYQTIARLGGDWYCRATDLFQLKRPR